MHKQLTDEQLDRTMRTLVKDAALDDSAVNEIAESPTMWWAVQRQITERKDVNVSAWPPAPKFWRWLMIGVPTAVAAALLVSFVVFRTGNLSATAGILPVNKVVVDQPTAPEESRYVAQTITKTERVPAIQKRVTVESVKFTGSDRTVKRSVVNSTTAATNKIEIKTDFIALSYARNPESGQIVRVKVPSSLMVTLGLVASVEKPSSLVDAEVVVGDDGLTRAIRFIH